MVSTTNDVRTGRVRTAEHLLVPGPVARDAALPVSAPHLAPITGRPGGELRPQGVAVRADRPVGGLEPTSSSVDLTSPVNGASGASIATGASGAQRPFRSCGTPVPGSAPTGTAP